MTPGVRREAAALIERLIRELTDRHAARPAGEESVEDQIARYRDSAELLVLEAIRKELATEHRVMREQHGPLPEPGAKPRPEPTTVPGSGVRRG